jgi:acetylornithine/succinyldiaminopimelate/putrescine aminotransferase
MVGAEFASPWADRGPDISRQLLQAGFIKDFHTATSTLRLFPPYVTGMETIDAFVETLRGTLSGLSG